MSRFLDEIKKGFNEGRQKAKAEANARRGEGNAKVIVFETTGKIKLATLCGDSVCRENLTAYKQCPQELLDCVPPEIVAFCKETAPHYLYLTKDENGETKWESTTGLAKI
ncbi:MAG: hypothetical protein HFJ58_05415 [Clostridia bacterium]|nr:hypothetical protein [Clostridia bacterium]